MEKYLTYLFAIIVPAMLISCSQDENPVSRITNPPSIPDTTHLPGWKTFKANTVKSLSSVAFLNENTGLCIGQLGTILKTTNSGTNWFFVNSPVTYSLNEIKFTSLTNAWIAGDFGTVLHSTDAGENWIALTNAGTTSYYSVFTLGVSLVWISGQLGRILRSTNSGSSWMTGNITQMPIIFALHFINENTGWAGGEYESVFKTTDGGFNWILKHQFQNFNSINSIVMIDNNTGYAFGGVKLKTTNQGETWFPISVPVNYFIEQFEISTPNYFLAAFNSVFAKSTDNGLNWIVKSYGVNLNFYSVDFINSTTGWIVSDSGYIFKTTTGGE